METGSAMEWYWSDTTLFHSVRTARSVITDLCEALAFLKLYSWLRGKIHGKIESKDKIILMQKEFSQPSFFITYMKISHIQVFFSQILN